MVVSHYGILALSTGSVALKIRTGGSKGAGILSNFCKEKGIRLSGPKLGRPNPVTNKTDKKLEYQDNIDRIEVEREFSTEKRCYGLGRIVTRLKETQLTSIALSVFVANLFKIQRRILFDFFYLYEILKEKTVWLSPCWT